MHAHANARPMNTSFDTVEFPTRMKALGQARIRAALQCADAAVEAMTIFGSVCLSQGSALHPMQRLLSSRTNPSESLRTAPEGAHLLAHGVTH